MDGQNTCEEESSCKDGDVDDSNGIIAAIRGKDAESSFHSAIEHNVTENHPEKRSSYDRPLRLLQLTGLPAAKATQKWNSSRSEQHVTHVSHDDDPIGIANVRTWYCITISALLTIVANFLIPAVVVLTVLRLFKVVDFPWVI